MNKLFFRKGLALLTVALLVGGFVLVNKIQADSNAVDFESYSLGSINGQDGWSSSGAAGSGCAVYDHAVAGSLATTGFGSQSLRISNAVTSGCFGDQTFSKSLINEVGEFASTNGGMSGGVRQNHFEAQFDFASTMATQQSGLAISVSPDRGDGSRMSYLRFVDDVSGIDVFFDDVSGVTSPVSFNEVQVADNLSRTTIHTAKFVIDYVDGPSNDIVKIYIDGILVKTGTTWENYFRFDTEASAEQTPRTTDNLIFRTGGTAIPATSGNGFLFDNLSLLSGPTPPGPVFNDESHDNILNGSEVTFPTIQAAVDAAETGDWIQVTAGTYSEHVLVNKEVTISGANWGVAGNGVRGAESIVDGTDTGAPFTIKANNVTINGFTVENGSLGGLDSGIWSQTGTLNSTITNNIITNNDFGVWAQCGGTCLIQANLFNGNNKPGAGSGSASISADSTTGLTINNNEFKNDTAGNPILLQAVGAGAHTSVVVSNNNFHDNTNSNVYVLGVTGGTFSGNTITPASDATGISFSGLDANITVTNNVITGGARGVRVEDAGYYGVGLGGNSNITVNRNSLATDSEYGAGNLSGYVGDVDATCNWWGATNGPGPVGTGSGSPVTTNVNAVSWLTSSDLDSACNGPTVAALSAEDFGVVNNDTGLGLLKGYTAGFGLTGATFTGAQVVMQLFSGTTLLQTNTSTAKVGTDITGAQISSPFDVSGTFDYVTDGFWTNVRGIEFGQSLPATKVVATVTLSDDTILTAENTTLTGDPTTIMPPAPTPPPPSGGGGGNSGLGDQGGGNNLPPPPPPLTPPTGQVLGASTGPIAGCDNRTTGFSVTTGQSCATNNSTVIPGCGNRTTGFSTVTGQSCATNTPHQDGQVLGAEKFIFTTFMKLGSKGGEVPELQKFLNTAGHNSGNADGKFGPKTKAAVIKFQLANGLKGDGIVGPLTRAVLNK